MNLKRKLQNPFALVVEGFVAGAILLYATTPADIRQESAAAPAPTAQGAKTPQA